MGLPAGNTAAFGRKWAPPGRRLPAEEGEKRIPRLLSRVTTGAGFSCPGSGLGRAEVRVKSKKGDRRERRKVTVS